MSCKEADSYIDLTNFWRNFAHLQNVWAFAGCSCTLGHEVAVFVLQILRKALSSAKNGALQFFLQCIKRSNFANPVYGLRLERAFGGLFVLFLCKIRPKFAEFGWKFAKHGQNLAEDGQNSQNWWQFCKIYKLSLLISQFWSPLLFRNYLFSRFAETGCADSQYFFCLFSFLAF